MANEPEKTQEDMPNYLVDQLRMLLQLNNLEPLPADVVREFWKLQGLFARIGANVSGHPLAILCYQLGYAAGISTQRKPASIREQWRAREVGVDTPVTIKWRKKDHSGVLKNVANNGLIVQIDGEDGERTVPEDSVTLLELATA